MTSGETGGALDIEGLRKLLMQRILNGAATEEDLFAGIPTEATDRAVRSLVDLERVKPTPDRPEATSASDRVADAVLPRIDALFD